MNDKDQSITHDFKGIGYSKLGHFKEVRTKIKELETWFLEYPKDYFSLLNCKHIVREKLFTTNNTSS